MMSNRGDAVPATRNPLMNAINPLMTAASIPTSKGTSRKTGQLFSGLPPTSSG